MRFHPVFDVRPEELAALRRLTPDQAMAEAAAARDGVLGHRQLAALGLDSSAVRRRLERRSLFRVHHGVYAVGRAELTRRGELRAALLRWGRGAVLSHRTAAWWLDLLDRPRTQVDVTTTARLPRAGACGVHLTRRWLAGDVVLVHGFPCTSVPRTLADLAAGGDGSDFGRAWDAADRQLLLDVGRLGAQIARQRTGCGLLRARLASYDETPPTESLLEEMTLQLCRDFALPTPTCQWPLPMESRCGRVDFVFWPQRVALEADGRKWHAVQTAFRQDREKDLLLRAAGFDPHRYSYWQIRDDAPLVAQALGAALEQRSTLLSLSDSKRER